MTSASSTSPELLKLFVYTADLGSIAAAARLMNLAPSLATRKIAQLESALGVRLFERTTRSMSLTKSGEVSLQWARATLVSHEALIDELAALQGEPSGEIRLIVSPYSAITFLPPLVAEFRALHPKVSLSIATTDTLVNLVDGHYDVAIHSGRVPPSNIVGQQIYEFERILCASPDYLRRRGVPEHPRQLEAHDCLTHSAIEGRTWSFRRGEEVLSLPLTPAIESDSFPVLLAMVREGLGVARLAENIVKDDIAQGALLALLPQYRCTYSDGSLPGLWITYPNRQMLKRTRLFVDFAVARLKLSRPEPSR
jgi:DNA-binding transcriptional LysR family regulator